MGASKRLAEVLFFARAGTAQGRRSMARSAVRFGNVIGSRGSVIPTFERQLKSGGPLTVTHPDVQRYFMMTSEAVSLVLQAAALGDDGDVFILEMGTPARILDVAREFVRLHGLEPDADVPIVFTGLRPGEKLVEILNYPDERLAPTRHPRLLRTRTAPEPQPEATVGAIRGILKARDVAAARAFLGERFPRLAAAATVRVDGVATHPVRRQQT